MSHAQKNVLQAHPGNARRNVSRCLWDRFTTVTGIITLLFFSNVLLCPRYHRAFQGGEALVPRHFLDRSQISGNVSGNFIFSRIVPGTNTYTTLTWHSSSLAPPPHPKNEQKRFLPASTGTPELEAAIPPIPACDPPVVRRACH